ncbi:MAG TPA: UDP-N-acetylglucosamine 1-carboxyvinyltransferase [Kiritimatiellia bacterium]|jgi:UDP-N-acetylglucosamine 1-carboxyvinyltransferase|nr:MAG: UDP-N-acetylglucosamine 1-carboxyvinyltransferase [Verrucomicrobia bacterium ADurb.Bin018]HOE01052.1 UDP-N-acetylglucosamine 1-carboxyvinyltransferase [Kiritimatiellia bacterium]HOE36698.1 UDP-N-acetylglucosamine 1-carboxyvinyltransferase [Kiritimatiellia bacterium]HOR75264.1 UDP-N-acetylglucosamine 1-carboxyvinyltransferase [Kiritimatiellia bacterium]HOU60020.1 UDP-N-acetylglucosamine 1-carboxyvinyltransferase [Kiritimatiellia bacterium]
MARLIIRGGKAITGTFRPLGNKNAVLPMLAASVLTDEPLTLDNVPQILDVENMLKLLAGLGVVISRRGHSVTLCARGLHTTTLDPALCAKVRGSILLAGPLAARHGRAILSAPGGDVIGRRRLDTHFEGLAQLGIRMQWHNNTFHLTRRRLRGAELLLDEASVTATENILMAATLAPGRTTIFNAACEPHVQDLGNLLTKMGARITGLGTNRLEVEGVKTLRGARHRVGPDYIEIGSVLAAAAATGGALTVTELPDATTLQVMQRAFGRLGVTWRVADSRLILPARQRLRVQQDLGGAIPKMEDGIWPAIPSDLLSVALVLATQTKGEILFFEKLFESRMYFVDRLLEMGATLVQCDPHRVVVSGPAKLRAQHITSPDIRAGMALIIAALCAKGTTVIEQAEMVDRGYERIEARLRALGADIRRAE